MSTIERPSTRRDSGNQEPPKSTWGDNKEPQEPSEPVNPNKRRNFWIKAGVATGIVGVAATGVVAGVNATNSPEGPTDPTEGMNLSPISSLVLNESDQAVIESGESGDRMNAIATEWIGQEINPYIQNVLMNFDDMDSVPFDAISEDPNSVVINELRTALKENVNEDNINSGWMICPAIDNGDPSCVVNGETMQSDINIGPTDENYDAKLVLLGDTASGEKMFVEVLVGNGDGTTLKMSVNEKGELKSN